jgi:hypothetical protein
MDVLREEVARLMEPAGFTVEWRDISKRRAGEDFAHLATVDFRGTCSVTQAASPSASIPEVRSLASTAVVDGQVLPFSSVNCDALRKVLAPVFATAPRTDHPIVFGRAVARVLAHELFHMLAQTKSHGTHGVSKACFGIGDLTAERFNFDSGTLAQMRPQQPEPIEIYSEESSGGR